MRYVLLFLGFFTLGTAMAHKYRIEPTNAYKEIPQKLFTSYDGVHWEFQEE